MKEITFGNARDLYEKGIHPRVVFGPDEMKMIKIRNKYGVGSRIARGIAEIGRDCLRKFSENRDYFTLLTSNGSAVASIYPIAETALIYQDSDCLELLREVFHAVCTEPKTEGFLKECKNNNSLFPDILHAFFPIYDWFYDLLS